MRARHPLIISVFLLTAVTLCAAPVSAEPVIERITTAAPFPRGLAMVDGSLYVLSRGRVRAAGGVTAAIDDRAGTIWRVDPEVVESITTEHVGAAVRTNGEVVAEPTAPPFHLWNRAATPPEADRLTDRPYCTLRYHAASDNFFICAFSGIDKPKRPGDPSFSKNLTDALLRYDRRDKKWRVVERHDHEAGGSYPHHDPAHHDPPHGRLNGPDNCLPLGNWLYAVAKDNSRLVRYDLRAIIDDPNAGPPPSEFVIGSAMHVRGEGQRHYHGHSALAYHDGWLYLATRTSSTIVRLRLDEQYNPVRPIVVERVAQFDPYDAATEQSANLTDMSFDATGRLYVVSAEPARVYRFTPNARRVFDGRTDQSPPWLDLAAATGNPYMKSENLLAHDGMLYVTSGDAYADQQGADGAVYRVRITD